MAILERLVGRTALGEIIDEVVDDVVVGIEDDAAISGADEFDMFQLQKKALGCRSGENCWGSCRLRRRLEKYLEISKRKFEFVLFEDFDDIFDREVGGGFVSVSMEFGD